MDNVTPRITEHVSRRLLDEAEDVIVIIQDSDGNTFENTVSIKNPNQYGFDVRPFLPNVVPFSMDVFVDTASRVIKDAQDREGIVESQRVKLVEQYPPDPFTEYGEEVITWRIKKRTPGMMDTKGKSRPHRKSTYFYELRSKYHPNKVVVVESRPVDSIVELACWAKTNRIANRRAIWLEKLIINHAWAFEVQGAERLFWEGRDADSYLQIGQQRVFSRPLNFMLRYRETEAVTIPTIKDITLEYSIPS